jgi:hypothetical protein
MPGDIPRKPAGGGKEAKYAQGLYEKVFKENRLGQVSGHRVMNTTGGKMIVPSSSGSKGSGASVQQFKLRFVEDDYLVCREWDGTTIGATDVYVLKPYKLRNSITSATVYGEAHAYTYAADASEPDMEYGTTVPDSDPAVNEWGETEADYAPGELLNSLKLNVVRTATVASEPEDQRVIPVWLKGDIIYGIEADDLGVTTTGYITDAGQSIDYLMIGESRQWARI